jgi:hypothetical protein
MQAGQLDEDDPPNQIHDDHLHQLSREFSFILLKCSPN